MPSPVFPQVPLTPKNAYKKYSDSSLMMVRMQYSGEAAASLFSPPPAPLCPCRITLCGRCALWRTGIQLLWGQGATLNPPDFRARLSPCRFEKPCCWPLGNWRGSGVRVGVWMCSYAYFMKLWYWASTCTTAHLWSTGATVFSLSSSRTERIPNPCSRSDIGSQNSTLTWRHCLILSSFAVFPASVHESLLDPGVYYFHTWGSGAERPALLTPDSKSISQTVLNISLIC